MTLTLMAEYQLWPLTLDRDGDLDNLAASEFASIVELPADLVLEIEVWDQRLQDTYTGNDPTQYGIRDPADQERFIATGRELARRIKQEVGHDIVVEYDGDGTIPTEEIQ